MGQKGCQIARRLRGTGVSPVVMGRIPMPHQATEASQRSPPALARMRLRSSRGRLRPRSRDTAAVQGQLSRQREHGRRARESPPPPAVRRRVPLRPPRPSRAGTVGNLDKRGLFIRRWLAGRGARGYAASLAAGDFRLNSWTIWTIIQNGGKGRLPRAAEGGKASRPARVRHTFCARQERMTTAPRGAVAEQSTAIIVEGIDRSAFRGAGSGFRLPGQPNHYSDPEYARGATLV